MGINTIKVSYTDDLHGNQELLDFVAAVAKGGVKLILQEQLNDNAWGGNTKIAVFGVDR